MPSRSKKAKAPRRQGSARQGRAAGDQLRLPEGRAAGDQLRLPDHWGIKTPSASLAKKIANYAYHVAPNNFTYWDKIFGPILLTAEYMGLSEQVHEVALPISEGIVKKWDAVATNWDIPPFKITNSNDMQGALCKEMARLYDHVTKNITKSCTDQEFLPWESVRGLWSACASFFRTYWFLHPHLTKIQAFANALVIGEDKINRPYHRLALEKSLVDAARKEHHAGLINTLLSTSLERVERQDNDTKIKNDYYMYKDEALAQNMLKAFFAAAKASTGIYQDMVLYSKAWIASKNTTAEDKVRFKEFLNIYSAKEVAAQREKRKRPTESEEEDADEDFEDEAMEESDHDEDLLDFEGCEKVEIEMSMSYTKIEPERQEELKKLFDEDILEKVFKLHAVFRGTLERMRRPKERTTRPTDALSVLKVRWDSNWRRASTKTPGGFIWLIYCGYCLDEVTPGQRATCHECKLAIHIGCGYRLNRKPITCMDCTVERGTNPPCETEDGKTVPAGPKWKSLQLKKYVFLMNFLNLVQTTRGGGPEGLTIEGIPSGELMRLTPEARLVLMATGMLDTKWMNLTTMQQCIDGLKSWLPTFYNHSCCAYLTLFYKMSKMSTTETDSIDKLLELYYKPEVHQKVKAFMAQVKSYEYEPVDLEQDYDEENSERMDVAASALTVMKNASSSEA
jgi:hypothetical protein